MSDVTVSGPGSCSQHGHFPEDQSVWCPICYTDPINSGMRQEAQLRRTADLEDRLVPLLERIAVALEGMTREPHCESEPLRKEPDG